MTERPRTAAWPQVGDKQDDSVFAFTVSWWMKSGGGGGYEDPLTRRGLMLTHKNLAPISWPQ